MAASRGSIHGEWSGRLMFVLAAIGSAVGLGNIWKFPYLAGQHGGGVFVLIYLAAVAVIGVPIMIAEIMIGRRGRGSPINSLRTLAVAEGRSARWGWLGGMGVATGFLILSYYSVIGGWTVAYALRTASGTFAQASSEAVSAAFNAFVGSPAALASWHTAFTLMTMFVVARGVRGGLERAARYMVPALFFILLLLVGFAAASGSFADGFTFLFAPDFARVSGAAILAALGQAFFSLSLGMGAIMAYGAYLPRNVSIAPAALQVAVADTVVALLAGLAIFPVIFANGLDPSVQSVALAFIALPLAFGQMPGGTVFGTLFFVLLVFAAWTSAISIIEPAVAHLVERWGMTRRRASLWAGAGVWLLGLGSVLSFNRWSEYTWFGRTFFEVVDFATSNVMLPLGGLLIALYAGWVMRREASADELALSPAGYATWRNVIRYLTPFAMLLVLLQVSGALRWLG
ncbi:MAG TPA: sodium-dependent transporter [Burkholderiales bacterium]